jgi:hypothetical protein
MERAPVCGSYLVLSLVVYIMPFSPGRIRVSDLGVHERGGVVRGPAAEGEGIVCAVLVQFFIVDKAVYVAAGRKAARLVTRADVELRYATGVKATRAL